MSVQPGFTEFGAKEYLKEYYASPLVSSGGLNPRSGYESEVPHLVRPENYHLLNFLSENFTIRDRGRIMAEIGGGPTVYSLISPARFVEEIHFADYTQQNLQEMMLWLKGVESAYDWDVYIKQALLFEGKKRISKDDILRRSELIRSKITQVRSCDITKKDPLATDPKSKVVFQETYDIVSTNFVAESITDSKDEWSEFVRNACSLIKRNGSLLMSSLLGAEYYTVNGIKNKAVAITEADVISILVKLGFRKFYSESIDAEVRNSLAQGYEGYQGIFIIRAFR